MLPHHIPLPDLHPIASPGDEMRDLEIVPDSLLHPSADRPTFIDRLANSLTKRKRSTPQKFVGKGLLPPQHGQMGEGGGGGWG